MQPQLRHDPLLRWRYRCLRRAGFTDAGARRLAQDGEFDLHALLELVDRGCPPDLAVRILAPSHWETRPS